MMWEVGDVVVYVDKGNHPKLERGEFVTVTRIDNVGFQVKRVDGSICGVYNHRRVGRPPKVSKLNKKLYPNYEEIDGYLVPRNLGLNKTVDKNEEVE